MFDITSIYTRLILILLGFNTGILSGFFGVGGCFILTPLLNILGLPMANAVGTGLFFAVIVSSLGGIKHYLAGNAIIKVSLIMGLLSFTGIQISQLLVIYLDQLHLAEFYIRLFYMILLLSVGFLTLRKKTYNLSESHRKGQEKFFLLSWIERIPPKITIESNILPFSIWLIAIIALLVGFLQGFMGVGGGFILVPIFIIFLNMKPHRAVGTSLLTIVISCIFAAFLYFQAGKVIVSASLLLGAGSLFGVSFGVSATRNILGEKLKQLYAIFLILASVGIAMKSFNYDLFSMIYILVISIGRGLLILFRYYFQGEHSFPFK